MNLTNDVLEKDSAPAWVDAVFVLSNVLIHVYYAFKFTFYSLDHIHRQLVAIDRSEQLMETVHKHTEVNNEADKMHKELNIDEKNDQSNASSTEKVEENGSTKIGIKLNYGTLARPLTGLPNTRCCCLFPWSPVLFTWSRTKYVRLFLRVFTLLCCSLGLVFFVEFLISALLEVRNCLYQQRKKILVKQEHCIVYGRMQFQLQAPNLQKR